MDLSWERQMENRAQGGQYAVMTPVEAPNTKKVCQETATALTHTKGHCDAENTKPQHAWERRLSTGICNGTSCQDG